MLAGYNSGHDHCRSEAIHLAGAAYNAFSALQASHVPQAVYDAQLAAGCMEGTRVQILDDIDSWIKNFKLPAIFWLTGMAGTGKTAINRTVCERARDNPEIVLGGSFFCSRSAGSIGQRDVRCVVPTLALLLARQSTVFSQALADELARDPDVLTKQITAQIKQLLYQPLLCFKDSRVPILFVIDALDECGSRLTTSESSDEAETHRIVSEMLEALVTFSRLSPRLPVKFMVTSRPETHIRETPVSDSAFSEVLRLHTVNKEQVTADIRLYIANRLSRSTQLRAWFTESEADLLANVSDGLFIVATTALQYAIGAGTNRATAEFKSILNESPGGLISGAMAPLDRMYSLIVEDAARGDDLSAMLQLLAALLSARMTLSVAALADLLNRPTIQLRAGLSRLHAVVHVPDDDDEAGMRTLHASFGDFLIGRARSHIRITTSLGHEVLGHACLHVMEKRLHFNVSNSRSSYELNKADKPDNITLSLEYACLHWIYHIAIKPEPTRPDEPISEILRQRLLFWIPHNPRPTPSRLDQKINDVLRPRFLYWLEVMSALGQVRRAAAMLSFAGVTVCARSYRNTHGH